MKNYLDNTLLFVLMQSILIVFSVNLLFNFTFYRMTGRISITDIQLF